MFPLLLRFLIAFCFAAEKLPEDLPVKGQAMPWVAHILRTKDTERIPGLSIPQNRLPVLLVPQNGDLRPLVEVKLKFDRPGWELLAPNGKKIKAMKDSDFLALYAFLNSQVNELSLISKNTEGEALTETLYLFAPEVQEFEIVSPWSSLYANIGMGQLTYKQTRFGSLVWKGVTAGIGYNTQEGSSPFDYHFYTRITVLSLETTPIAANPQYINGHAHVSYRLPWGEQTRWRYYGFAGIGYYNLNSFGSPFGFSGLFAPQLAFRAKHFLTTKSAFLYDVKLTPFENIDLNDARGVELSWTWSKTLKSFRRQDVSIRYDNTRFRASGQQIGIEYVSINLGYSL